MGYFVIDRALIAVDRRFSRRIRHIQLELLVGKTPSQATESDAASAP